ncbi:MAG: PKD domain-containing protein, partial [Ferruginibacter sp.]|nr:PKD domain-containing protein [Ferruginibacter sp.]
MNAISNPLFALITQLVDLISKKLFNIGTEYLIFFYFSQKYKNKKYMKKITFKLFLTAFVLLISNLTLFAQPPTLTGSPNQGCAPLTVTFNLAGISSAHRVEWNFNDGSPVLKDTMPLFSTVSHTFSTTGNYNVYINTFDMSNNFLGAVNCNTSIMVNGFSISTSDSACMNDIVNFNVKGQGQPNSATWNFGDGSPSSNQFNPSHAYTTVGAKTVTLVTSGGQCGNQILTKTIYVSTNAYPHPYAWANSNYSCTTVPITFSTGTFTSYSWSFGDGTNSNLQNPQHLYTTNGTKTVSLTVMNGCGKTGTTTMTVNISATPAFPNYPDFK